MTRSTPDAVRAHNEIWNERDYAKIPDVISESYVEYNPIVPGGELRGHDGLEKWLREVTAAFPDLQAEILDLVAGDGTAMSEVRFAMTHEGEFRGIEPTGRDVEFRGMATFRVEDGKVTELRNYFDPGELFERLGVADGHPAGRERSSRSGTTSAGRLERDRFDRDRGEFDRNLLANDYRLYATLGRHETHTLE